MTHETTGSRPETTPDERELEALAIQEQFAQEYRAGRNPRLADYLRAYPEHAGSLSDFVARLLDEGDALEAGSAPAPLSVGSRRALDAIFGERSDRPEMRKVAESRARYRASGEATDGSDDQTSDKSEDVKHDD